MSSSRKFRATRAVPVFPGTSELAFIPDREIFTVPASRRLRSRPHVPASKLCANQCTKAVLRIHVAHHVSSATRQYFEGHRLLVLLWKPCGRGSLELTVCLVPAGCRLHGVLSPSKIAPSEGSPQSPAVITRGFQGRRFQSPPASMVDVATQLPVEPAGEYCESGCEALSAEK
jgi:hypothetical protein